MQGALYFPPRGVNMKHLKNFTENITADILPALTGGIFGGLIGTAVIYGIIILAI